MANLTVEQIRERMYGDDKNDPIAMPTTQVQASRRTLVLIPKQGSVEGDGEHHPHMEMVDVADDNGVAFRSRNSTDEEWSAWTTFLCYDSLHLHIYEL